MEEQVICYSCRYYRKVYGMYICSVQPIGRHENCKLFTKRTHAMSTATKTEG